MSETERLVSSCACMVGHANWWMTSFCQQAFLLGTFEYQCMDISALAHPKVFISTENKFSNSFLKYYSGIDKEEGWKQPHF